MLLRFAEICSNHDPSGVFSASGDILCFSVVVKASAAGIIGKADFVAMVAGCERVAVCITRARHLLYGSFHDEPEFRLSLRLCFCSDIAACGMRASALAMVAHSKTLLLNEKKTENSYLHLAAVRKQRRGGYGFSSFGAGVTRSRVSGFNSNLMSQSHLEFAGN